MRHLTVILVALMVLSGLGCAHKQRVSTGDAISVNSDTGIHTEKEKTESGHSEKNRVLSNTVALSPFVVCLADTNTRRYLKVALAVEIAGPSELLVSNMAKVRDSLLLLLTSKTSQDLSSLEGRNHLRKEIVDHLNQVLGQAKVAQAYYTDFVIQ